MARKTTMPKVSVVVPTYNVEATILPALQSLLNQTFSDFEVLVVDDASTDRTCQRVSSLRDPRVRLLRQSKNGGAPVSRNHGLKHCRGHYIAMLDADDLSEQGRLAAQAAFLDENPGIGLLGGSSRWFGQGQPYFDTPPQSPEAIKAAMFFGCCILHSTIMFRASLLPPSRQLFNPKNRTCDDFEHFTGWLLQGVRFAALPQVLVSYRLHEGQISQRYCMEQSRRIIQLQQRWLRAMGIKAAPEEMGLHSAFCRDEWPQSLGELERLEAWLRRLEQANRGSRVIDASVFHDSLALRWQAALLASSHLGLGALWLWLTSPLKQARWPFRVKTLALVTFCLEGSLGAGFLAAWYRRHRRNPLANLQAADLP